MPVNLFKNLRSSVFQNGFSSMQAAQSVEGTALPALPALPVSSWCVCCAVTSLLVLPAAAGPAAAVKSSDSVTQTCVSGMGSLADGGPASSLLTTSNQASLGVLGHAEDLPPSSISSQQNRWEAAAAFRFPRADVMLKPSCGFPPQRSPVTAEQPPLVFREDVQLQHPREASFHVPDRLMNIRSEGLCLCSIPTPTPPCTPPSPLCQRCHLPRSLPPPPLWRLHRCRWASLRAPPWAPPRSRPPLVWAPSAVWPWGSAPPPWASQQQSPPPF